MKKCHFFMFHMTRATAPSHRRRGEVQQRSTQRRGAFVVPWRIGRRVGRHHPYPGRSDGSCSLILLHRRRPSPSERRVGICVRCFEACSVFTRITTYMLTEPLERLFASKASAASLPLPPLRLLPGGTNQFPGGSIPR